MIDSVDLLSLETPVRRKIGEPSAALWTREDIFDAINEQVTELERLVIGMDCGYMEQVYTTTPAATIALPINCHIVRNVELYINGAWVAPRWINDHTRGQYQALSGSTYPDAVQFFGNSIVFESGISSASSVRIKFARLTAAMRYETLASGSATTAVMSNGSVIDDIYNDDQFIVLEGTGVGQISKVTDYVGSTKTLTIASGATLDGTTVISWLLPEPLRQWPDVVILGAAADLVSRRRDTETQDRLMAQFGRKLSDMMSALSSRQTEHTQRGNYLPTGDE